MLLLSVAATLSVNGLHANSESDWARYRGPNGSGVSADGQEIPVTWDAEKNMKWKVALPGPGHSCPIVVGDKVLLTCWTGYGLDAEEPGDQKDLRLHLLCYDRMSGKQLWSTAVEPSLPEERYGGMFAQHGYATHTPVSDGERVFAFFGKTGLVAFDLNGKKLWQKEVGDWLDRRGWGSASSPILYKNLVIVTASVEDEAVVALDKATGKEVWKQAAEGFGGTWGTPALAKVGDRTDLVLSVPYEVWGMNPETGKLRWYAEASQDNTACSSVIVDGEMVYVIGGREGGTVAVRAGGKGDVTESHRLWESNRSGRTASPILHEGRLHWINGGLAYCIDAKTGKDVYRARVNSDNADRGGGEEERRGGRGGRGGFGSADYASPVTSGDRLYQLKRNGEMVVVQLGEEYKELAVNRFDGGGEFSATPAISRGDLFVRSTAHLYCVGAASE